MRHRNSGRKLGRTSAHRKALFKNLATALLVHGRITTTEIKAKEIRGVVEPLITLAQRDDLHSRRQAYRVLGCHKLVKRLFGEIGPAFKGVAGGYTRVVKLAMPRKGDSAPMAIIELTHGQIGKLAAAAPAPAKPEVKEEAAPVSEAGAEKPKKTAAPKAPKAARSTTRASKVAGAKPKSTPRKMEG